MDVLVLMLASVGIALLAHRHQMKHMRLLGAPRELFEGDAEVAIAVAAHEARSRSQQLSALHVLYGLLQDESFTSTIASLGGNAQAIEERVTTELDRERAPDPDEGALVLGRAAGLARQHGRKATCADIWSFASRTHTANLVEVGGITAYALMFALAHRGAKPAAALAGQTRVDVVLRNDDYTSRDYVVSVLREVFSVRDAEALMARTHDEGRCVIGRYDATEAKSLVERAQAHARDNGFPLWIGVEPF